MTRPLRYDDSFTNIINEKIHDKFLQVFNVKVQSTGFRQKLNLQRSLLIVSAWDILLGTIILFAFFRNIQDMQQNIILCTECFILMIGACFGFVGIDSATNLRKVNTKIYKNWRVFVTFAFPLLEMISNFAFFCYFWNQCSILENFILILINLFINIYWTKIAWSFYIRISRGHELLIIHGKYLDKMIEDESYKLNDVKKYVPPEQLMGNKLLNSTNATAGAEAELSIFGTKTGVK